MVRPRHSIAPPCPSDSDTAPAAASAPAARPAFVRHHCCPACRQSAVRSPPARGRSSAPGRDAGRRPRSSSCHSDRCRHRPSRPRSCSPASRRGGISAPAPDRPAGAPLVSYPMRSAVAAPAPPSASDRSPPPARGSHRLHRRHSPHPGSEDRPAPPSAPAQHPLLHKRGPRGETIILRHAMPGTRSRNSAIIAPLPIEVPTSGARERIRSMRLSGIRKYRRWKKVVFPEPYRSDWALAPLCLLG